MNKTKIEWTDFTWNPLVGCKNSCWYCFAKRLNDRFGWLKVFTEPKFYPERLGEPYNLKKPSKIFVCSMADLFGDWVDYLRILQVIQVANDNPQHTFQFLTKNPKRYLEFDFPKNCWLGITITNSQEAGKLFDLLQKNNYKFVSIEPLLGGFGKEFNKFLTIVDLVIVGAMTGMGKKNVIPKKEWIDSIKHPNIFYKDNIKKFLALKDEE